MWLLALQCIGYIQNWPQCWIFVNCVDGERGWSISQMSNRTHFTLRTRGNGLYDVSRHRGCCLLRFLQTDENPDKLTFSRNTSLTQNHNWNNTFFPQAKKIRMWNIRNTQPKNWTNVKNKSDLQLDFFAYFIDFQISSFIITLPEMTTSFASSGAGKRDIGPLSDGGIRRYPKVEKINKTRHLGQHRPAGSQIQDTDLGLKTTEVVGRLPRIGFVIVMFLIWSGFWRHSESMCAHHPRNIYTNNPYISFLKELTTQFSTAFTTTYAIRIFWQPWCMVNKKTLGPWTCCGMQSAWMYFVVVQVHQQIRWNPQFLWCI